MIKLKDLLKEGNKMNRLGGRYGGEPNKAIADPGDKDVENPVVSDSKKGGKNRGKGRTAKPRSKHFVNEKRTNMKLKEILLREITLRDIGNYLTQQLHRDAIDKETAVELYQLYSDQIESGKISERDALNRLKKDVEAQTNEAGDPLRKSFGRGNTTTDYGTNSPQNRTNFRPGSPNPKTQQAKAPKPKPIKEAGGNAISDTARLQIYRATANMHKLLDAVSKRTGRRPPKGQNYLDVDGALQVQKALWEVEITARHMADFVGKLLDQWTRTGKA